MTRQRCCRRLKTLAYRLMRMEVAVDEMEVLHLPRRLDHFPFTTSCEATGVLILLCQTTYQFCPRTVQSPDIHQLLLVICTEGSRTVPNMLQLSMRSSMRGACQSPFKLPAYQQLVRLPTSRLGRSMSTKKDGKVKDDSAKSKPESPLPETVRQDLERLKQTEAEVYKKRHEVLKAKREQISTQRSIGGAEGRKRALTRINADIAALKTRSMYFSAYRFASLFEAQDVRRAFDWCDEDLRMGWLNFQVQAVKAKLWIFAPAKEVSVLSRFMRLVAFIGWSAFHCLQGVVAVQVQILRLVLSLVFPTLRR